MASPGADSPPAFSIPSAEPTTCCSCSAWGRLPSCLSWQLLLWGLAGGLCGAMGGTLPAREFLAALAISGVAVHALRLALAGGMLALEPMGLLGR